MAEQPKESSEGTRAPKTRVDWRSGKTVLQHDGAFWREHECRRLEAGMSVSQYCKANGLALSTYRHRVSGRKASPKAASTPSMGTSVPGFVAVAAAQPPGDAAIGVVLEGMTLKLFGAAAERVLARVLARLA